MVKNYLGIDESNHGMFPEIFVCVHSTRHTHIREMGGLPKRRKDEPVYKILKRAGFRHIIIPQEYSLFMDHSEIRVMSICELIRSFLESEGSIDAVLVDGGLRPDEMEAIHMILYPRNTPSIIAQSSGDTIYPIVNTADAVANSLHRYYASKKSPGQNRRYLRKLVTPRIEDYRELFSSR